MIIGIGTDIVDIPRIERSLAVYGDRFRDRIFTPEEISYSESHLRSGERYAARFAAKEAARKAFGAATSIQSIAWRDVEIISSIEGAPQLRFHGAALELAASLQIRRAHVSLSHASHQSVAVVILEGDNHL
ncbi:MAG: holo-[acyl-carrier-protein] synthase [Acidobacteria bacterium]|nr:holo-[acyl-carrier-protein] synthase [Acidobacteriota bacterium]